MDVFFLADVIRDDETALRQGDSGEVLSLLKLRPGIREAGLATQRLLVSIAGELNDVEGELAFPAFAPVVDHRGQQLLILEGTALI